MNKLYGCPFQQIELIICKWTNTKMTLFLLDITTNTWRPRWSEWIIFKLQTSLILQNNNVWSFEIWKFYWKMCLCVFVHINTFPAPLSHFIFVQDIICFLILVQWSGVVQFWLDVSLLMWKRTLRNTQVQINSGSLKATSKHCDSDPLWRKAICWAVYWQIDSLDDVCYVLFLLWNQGLYVCNLFKIIFP